MRWCSLILLLSVSTLVSAKQMCHVSEYEKRYFDLTDNYPFSDEDFSPENVNLTVIRLKAFKSGEEVEYFIHQNADNIIKGGFLQQTLISAKFKFDNTEYDKNLTNSDILKFDDEVNYLKSKLEYCNYQKSTYNIDW